MADNNSLLDCLIFERKNHCKGGIYHRLQVDFAYNSNHIEGSRLTHDETRYIYETRTINAENANVNDIIETVNHFRCLDYIIDTVGEPLTEEYLKTLHKLLKQGTMSDDSLSYAVIGDYKVRNNFIADVKTVSPKDVPQKVNQLLENFNKKPMDIFDIAEFHANYEKIHPFFDGNGRTGRLIMLKQCLENGIMPIIIDEYHKMYYYMGLKEWQTTGECERLIEVFLSVQDKMKTLLNYFEIEYDSRSFRARDVISEHLKKTNN